MKRGEECVQEVNHSNITVEERGRRANFSNAARATFRRIRVDNCLITHGPRADWIISKVSVGSVIVELKGKDVAHACEQIFATLESSECKPWLEKKRALLIICSRLPVFDTTVARFQETARKRGVRLKIVCDKGEFVIESLLGIEALSA